MTYADIASSIVVRTSPLLPGSLKWWCSSLEYPELLIIPTSVRCKTQSIPSSNTDRAQSLILNLEWSL